jgi:hypothetical protein
LLSFTDVPKMQTLTLLKSQTKSVFSVVREYACSHEP